MKIILVEEKNNCYKQEVFRPQDVNNLLGNSKKAKKFLNWKPKIKLDDLIFEMIEEETKYQIIDDIS